MEDRVVEKSNSYLFFAFGFGVFPGVRTFEKGDVHHAIEDPAELGVFGNGGLFEEDCFFWVEAEGEIGGGEFEGLGAH